MVEAHDLSLPDDVAIPAPDARRRRFAHLSGRSTVEMVREDLLLSVVLTRPAFETRSGCCLPPVGLVLDGDVLTVAGQLIREHWAGRNR